MLLLSELTFVHGLQARIRMTVDPEKCMERALELAEMGRGFTSPNPLVGAVIVNNGRVIAEGYHRHFGNAHAEVEALKAAGAAAKGSIMYITLEPCCHQGKTPPCTRAIREAGISKVVMAMEDPNPLVAGKGRKELEDAGIIVESGLMKEHAEKLNEWFVKFATTRIPFFVAKAAMTLDGKIATREGDSRWITGEEARHYVHWLRSGVDAVMVGSGTAGTDDPMLTTRMPDGSGRDAARVIVDGDARLSPALHVFGLQSSAPTIVVVKSTAPADRMAKLAAAGADLLETGTRDGKVDLLDMARELGKRDIASVMIEGGGGLLAAAFEAQIIDKVLFFIAPKIIGGEDAPTPVEGAGRNTIAEAIQLDRIRTRRFENDFLIEGYVVK
jgi:diaminohydroxyphosphoribosylaminopyrimidine deaminase/5-amino-6-(5-phosphoribosylamino)uracil reductase